MWINSGEERLKLVEKLRAIRSDGSFTVEDDLQTRISTTKDCLGLIIRKSKDTLTAKLTSWNCNKETSLICALDASQFTLPQKPVKFPCIPRDRETRVKRDSVDENIDVEEEQIGSKF